jgi:hypothetical protein
LIKLSLKGLVEIVTVTVILIVTVDLVVAVTMAVVVRRVVVVGTASSAANLDTLLESAQMVTAGEVTDMVAGMIGMVVVDLTVVATVLIVAVIVLTVTVLTVAAIVLTVTVLTVAATVLTVTVIDLSVAVTDILAVAEMVGAGVTATVMTDQVPTDSQDLEKCVSSRYENPIYYHEVCFLVFETL